MSELLTQRHGAVVVVQFTSPKTALAAFDGRACPAGPPAADGSERAVHARHADRVGQSVAE